MLFSLFTFHKCAHMTVTVQRDTGTAWNGV